MRNIISYFILLILFYSCSEKIEYKELAAEKAKEMNCMEDIELLGASSPSRSSCRGNLYLE